MSRQPRAGRRPLRIAYVVPGHGLLATAGPTRNVLSLARALDGIDGVEVEVAFRCLLDERPPPGLRFVEIEPGAIDPAAARDDSAMQGLSVPAFLRYLARLRRFVVDRAAACDVILEKSWLLSGWLSGIAERQGVLGVAVENVVPSPQRHDGAGLLKQARVVAGRHWAGRCLRRTRLVIAETRQLEQSIVESWGVARSRIRVVGLGVDKRLFRPIDQAAARQRLGVASEKTVLTYVGLLDATHNLAPLVEAVAELDPPGLELRIVGDGPARAELVAKARGAAQVVMCGRVPHDEVPWQIAVADLCLAPYDSRAFAGGALGYSTMKIPEYMSVGRPVVAAPSARAQELIEDQVSGMLLANEPAEWRRLLQALPSREALAQLGEAAQATPLPAWDDTARGYLAAIEQALAETEPR